MNQQKQIDAEQAALAWDAVRLAEEKHADQKRVGGEPYVCHIYRVLLAGIQEFLKDPSLGVEFLIAIALHDGVEDCGVPIKKIQRRYGAEVAHLVFHLSHQTGDDEPDEIYLAQVKAGGRKAILIKRLDKLDNIRSLSQADVSFRQQKLTELPAFLKLWKEIDPEGAEMIEGESKKSK